MNKKTISHFKLVRSFDRPGDLFRQNFSLKTSPERSEDLTIFKCETVSLLVSLNSFHLYLFTNSVNLSVFEYIYIGQDFVMTVSVFDLKVYHLY